MVIPQDELASWSAKQDAIVASCVELNMDPELGAEERELAYVVGCLVKASMRVRRSLETAPACASLLLACSALPCCSSGLLVSALLCFCSDALLASLALSSCCRAFTLCLPCPPFAAALASFASCSHPAVLTPWPPPCLPCPVHPLPGGGQGQLLRHAGAAGREHLDTHHRRSSAAAGGGAQKGGGLVAGRESASNQKRLPCALMCPL